VRGKRHERTNTGRGGGIPENTSGLRISVQREEQRRDVEENSSADWPPEGGAGNAVVKLHKGLSFLALTSGALPGIERKEGDLSPKEGGKIF